MHPSRMFPFVGLILSFAALPPLSAATLPLRELFQRPDRYYGQRVEIIGTIADYAEHISTRGVAYTIFRLDEEYSVFVVARERQGLRTGLKAKVIGTFKKDKDVDSATFRMALGPKEDKDVDFALANRLIRDGVCCACGYFRFAWSVRNQYPSNAHVVEFFNEMRGAHLSYGVLPRGRGDASICSPIVAVNRTADRLLIDITYTAGASQVVDAQRIEVQR